MLVSFSDIALKNTLSKGKFQVDYILREINFCCENQHKFTPVWEVYFYPLNHVIYVTKYFHMRRYKDIQDILAYQLA